MLTKNLVKSPENALVYLAECTLATVFEMAMKKSKGKHEFERQISIAQSAVNWIKAFDIKPSIYTTVYNVLSLPDQSVKTWIREYLTPYINNK